MGPTAVAYLTLPRLDHTCAAVLSADVRICAKVYILGARSYTWAKSAEIWRSLMVTYPVGLVSVTSHACVASEKGKRQTNHWLSGSWQTPPTPKPDASFALSHIRGRGSISQRCVGRAASS